MTATTDEQGLRRNLPGQAVIAKLLAEQANVKPRGSLAQLFGISPLHVDSRPWYWGALGEIAVGDVLSTLGPEWQTLHAVPVGTKDSDIDHVVVGPAGVFTINTKNHSHQSVWVAGRTFMVAGQRQTWIPDSEHEAQRASKLLTAAVGFPVDVRPLIVVHDPARMIIREQPAAVAVVTSRSLLGWLRKQPTRLSQQQVASIAEPASRAGTWRKTRATRVDAAQNVQDFAALDRDVRSAMRVRLLWRFGFAAGVMATSWRLLASLG